jgi:predicted metal-dependent phosphoesterase TrpH
MYKVDLHTHSIASRDGGIQASQYEHALSSGLLDYIAITDHNKVSFALELQQQLGDHIIVGEEINTIEGEIIGLYLQEAIPRDLPAHEAVKRIKHQAGLVYIPHPFETVRRGIQKSVLEQLIDTVDIIEVYNGRAVFQNKGPQAVTAARLNNKPGAASSDAHGAKGLGTAYSLVKDKPTVKNLPKLLHTAQLAMEHPPLKTLLYPKFNRIRKGWVRD